MRAPRFAGWRGAIILLSLMATALALPLLFRGTGSNAVGDWALLFITLVFVVLPPLCVLHIAMTAYLAWTLSGRRRAIELGALAVPVAYLAALANMDLVVAKVRALLG